MKTSILNTEFNFAKSINLSLIAAPNAYPSYPQGIKLFKHLNIFLEREYCEY